MRTAAFLIVAATFTANTPLWAGESGEHGSMSVYAAGPCAAPGYGAESLQSGCCQCQRSCCDDAWAGYCQKKHQGFCLPCIRPARGQCATVPSARCAECQSGMPTPPSTDHELEPPSAPPPSVKPKLPPLPTTKLPPTPAPKLPAPTAPLPSPPAVPDSGKTSDKTGLVFPVFNPAAWKIGLPAK